ncbi:HAMP domain-containing protein [bacterium]|nr:HAMP domain-containing protein [bacterium]
MALGNFVFCRTVYEMSSKVKIRVRSKIFVGVSALLGIAIVSIVWISSELYVNEARLFFLKQSSDNSRNTAARFRQEVEGVLQRVSLWVENSSDQKVLLERLEQSSKVMGVGVYRMSDGHWKTRALPESVSEPTLDELNALNSGEMSFNFDQEQQAFRLWVLDRSNVDALALCVYLKSNFADGLLLGESYSEVFLFSKLGEVFSSSMEDSSKVLENQRVPSEIINMLNVPISNLQVNYRKDSIAYIGSYAETGIANLGVLVLTPETRVMEVPQKIALRSLLLGLAILCFSLMVASFFSDSLVSPVLRLVEMTKQLAAGDFAVRLKPSTRDEISLLTNSFNEMAKGLAEREKLKGVFGRFHSKAVFEKLLGEEELQLGGERLDVTVFFSDIRSFTSQSEKLSPEQVVEMLNEYMSVMVSVVEKHGGVVDKFVGDAIMAVWGLPKPDPINDAKAAVRACLEMRQQLMNLNEIRKARGDEPISIGMGLNCGPVIAGNIGSESRMEYTVIGDTVNTASRMESLCKEMETDFILHESVKNHVEDEFTFGEAFMVHAKGKQDDVKVYKLEDSFEENQVKAA